MKFNRFKHLGFLFSIGLFSIHAFSQNVGIGTNQPDARLHVAGAIQTDSALTVKPYEVSAADTITVPATAGLVMISIDSNSQTNVVQLTGTPKAGQFLQVINSDNQSATFSGFRIGNGTSATFVYSGSEWKSTYAFQTLSDSDGDTRVEVETTPDADQIKLVFPQGSGWVFSNGNLNPPGIERISIGHDAGYNLNGDEFNVIVIGDEAGYNLTDEAKSIIAIGANALSEGGEIESSVAIGAGSLSNATGNSNTALGTHAGRGSTTYSGDGNTFIGASSGSFSGGSNNTSLGVTSGYNATGSGNVFLGASAGFYETGSNKLYIENSRDSFPLIYGEFDNNLLRVNGQLDINNAYQLPIVDGDSGQVMTTDGSGTVSWTTLASAASDSITDADGDTKILVEATPDEDLIKLVIPDGSSSSEWVFSNGNLNTPSPERVSIGDDAGFNLNGDEVSVITIGPDAGYTLTDETTKTIAIGSGALYEGGEMEESVAIGTNSLYHATGFQNTAVGNLAGVGFGENQFSGRENVFIGNTAGYQAKGSFNVMVGSQAGRKATGARNVFLGYQTGYNNTGSYNVFLGQYAGYNETGSNKLYISNSDTTNPLIYGEFDNNLLRVNGQLDINNAYQLPIVDGDSGQVMTTDGSGTVSWTTPTGAASDSITDADGDTKILVEASPDEDLIKLVIPLDTFPTEWVFSNYNLSTPDEDIVSIGQGAGGDVGSSTQGVVAIGENAGSQMTDASVSSTAVGSRALFSVGESEHNTAIGASASYHQTGTYNTSLGSFSGRGNPSASSGDYNVTVGASAGINLEGSRNVFVGNSSGYNNTGSDNIFLGYRAGRHETGSNKLIIENSDTANPLIYGEFDNRLLRVNGILDVNNAYQLPLADGNAGQVLTTDGSGAVTWTTAYTDADEDTKIQVEESADEDAIRFDLGGSEKWIMVDDRIEPSSDNTLIGQNAGDSLTSATGLTGFGANALQSNTTGTNNVAIGMNAFQALTTGQFNGAFGTNAGYHLESGNRNVFVGNSAGYENVSGNANTFIGQFAGYNNTGSGNVFIGRHAGGNDTSSNKLYIANSNTNSPLIYGEFDNEILEINGQLRPGTDNSVSLGASGRRWTAVHATNGTIQTSDARFKTGIADMNYGLDEVMKLRSVSYQWKQDSTGATKLGFIAQELETVIPEVVHVANDSFQTRGVNYAELVPLLVKAIQEQQAIIAQQKQELADQKSQDVAQDARLERLESRLMELLILTSTNEQ